LRDGRETASLNLLGIELKSILGEFEPLLNESSELANTATLLSKDFLGMCGANDYLRLRGLDSCLMGRAERTDLCARVRDTDIAARVTFFRELAGEKLVQLGTEDTICNKLALFADLSGHAGKLYKQWAGILLAQAISCAHIIQTRNPASSPKRRE